MSTLNLPADGSVIIFDRVPISSYADVGEAYRVQVRGSGRKAYVYLTSVARGSGTFDRGWAYKQAAWRYAETA